MSTLLTPHQRFWRYVQRTETCWFWTGSLNNGGYGRFTLDHDTVLAHRWIWEEICGPIPDGLHIDHLCRVRNCVNPTHLEPVTPAINVYRGIGPTAKNARKIECKRGHLFTPENTRIKNKGNRSCRQCEYLRKHPNRTDALL